MLTVKLRLVERGIRRGLGLRDKNAKAGSRYQTKGKGCQGRVGTDPNEKLILRREEGDRGVWTFNTSS